MRVLVCGDRRWDDQDLFWAILDGIEYANGSLTIIEGDAQGADKMAGEWADCHFMPLEVYPADWDRYGGAAGPVRNQQMLDEGRPELVLAFHDNLPESRGTADMVRRAKKAGVPVVVISHG